jgi:hypothetical protein
MAEAESIARTAESIVPPSVTVPGNDVPVRLIKSSDLRQLGQNLDKLFKQYVSDRRIAELRWLRNLRQYLGFYDPEIEKELSPNRSRAYPKVTRIKCISMLSRIMNLLFPGNERNWEITAGPSPDMDIEDVEAAIQEALEHDQSSGMQPEVDLDYVMSAVKCLAEKRAENLAKILDDQLEELGGDQTLDYIALNRKVLQSGIMYGLGVLEGPYARPVKTTTWDVDPVTKRPIPKTKTVYKPMFEFRHIWDFYPDMSAKTLYSMDGYFVRTVMSRAQVRDLADREDFFKDQVLKYLNMHPVGNYVAQPFETELRAMGVKVNVNEMKTETMKYEVLVWHGPVSGEYLRLAGVDVDANKLADDIDAEVWMIDGYVIKAVMNPWTSIGANVRTIHTFLFDEDDTSPVGQGLPNVVRDSQMSIAAATRMMLDNASIVCGPNLELNTTLLRLDQDLSSVQAYKIWYRDDDAPTAQFPAIRPISFDSHLQELMQIVDTFMKFADLETFVGPATGGDIEHVPSEPMRTAAGASMLRGDAALPFKDVVRNFDTFTESLIYSLVEFNRKFNPVLMKEADFNVIGRGATSLIAKELRGMQVDQLAATLRPEEALHVDDRKFVQARFEVRDLGGLLVTPEEAARRKAAQDQQMSQQAQQQSELAAAEIRKTFADAYKNITQGQKNSALADVETVNSALAVLEKGASNGGAQAGPAESIGSNSGSEGEQPISGGPEPDSIPAPGGEGQPGGMPPGGIPGMEGPGPGIQ